MVLRGLVGIRVVILVIGVAVRVAKPVGSPEAIVVHIQVVHIELCNLAHKAGVSYVGSIRCLTFTHRGWFRRLLSFDTLSAPFPLDLHMPILDQITVSPLFKVESVTLKSIR